MAVFGVVYLRPPRVGPSQGRCADLQNVVILVPSSTLGIWALVNWGFGNVGTWDNGLLGESGLRESRDRGKRRIETRGIDRTGTLCKRKLKSQDIATK